MSDVSNHVLPQGWASTTLGQALSWGSGGTPLRSRAEYYNGNIPWAIIGDLSDGLISTTASFITELGLRKSAAKWIEADSVLLAMYGSIGKLGINTIPLSSNQAIAFTTPRPISSKYLLFFLMSARPELISKGKGGTQSNISQAVVKAFRFVVAPLAEQHRIVGAIESYFTRLDDAVATLERVQRNLKRYRASVLKAAVEGRLVPTEAELARAEARDYEPASVLLERILAERRRRWEEAELAKMKMKGKVPKDDKWKAKYEAPVVADTTDLPELPEGWCWTSLDQLAHLVRNGYSKKPEPTGEVRILRISAVRPMKVDFADSKWLPGRPADYAGDLIQTGDLLFTRYNGSPALVGVSGLVKAIDRPTVHPDKLIKVRFVHSDLDLTYLELTTNTGRSRRFVESRIRTTAGQAGISGGDVKQIPIPLPPGAEQVRISRETELRLSLADDAITGLEASSLRLARLRQSILKWAFEGRLVDQDPTDGPASALLERIRAEREPVGNGKPGRGGSRTVRRARRD